MAYPNGMVELYGSGPEYEQIRDRILKKWATYRDDVVEVHFNWELRDGRLGVIAHQSLSVQRMIVQIVLRSMVGEGVLVKVRRGTYSVPKSTGKGDLELSKEVTK